MAQDNVSEFELGARVGEERALKASFSEMFTLSNLAPNDRGRLLAPAKNEGLDE